MPYEIKFDNVTFSYAGSPTPAIKNINLSIAQGEIILVTGPSGSGKTTLCSCINGLIPHYHDGTLTGEVTVGPYNTRKARVGGLASIVGMVFQDPESQIVTNSVMDEVAFGPENFGVPRDEINRRAVDALQATRLLGYEDREPQNLSGGEQQACVIAATYAMNPEIYVMDEPLANLDPAGRAHILKLVIQVAKDRGKTLVIVEHALEDVLPVVDRVIVMKQGEIVRDGPTREVLAAGDIPHVFKRPDVYRLAEDLDLAERPLSAEGFASGFRSRYKLNTLKLPKNHNGHHASTEPVIEFKNVTFHYKPETPALHDVSLTIHAGELVAILGRNGSGKTTLVRHVIGLQQPSSGTVTVVGKDVATTPTHILAQDVGFCFQNPNHQIVSFNVRDEMTFGLKSHNIDPAEHESRIREALEIVDLTNHLDTEVFDLGKGQKQRLALASVLTLKPRILVIDEPTTGQDPEMIDDIFRIIKRLNELGTTILLITHRIDYAALFARRAIVLQYGRVSYDGHIRNLLENTGLMRENSLDLPEITKLSNHFKEQGIPPWTVDYEEMKGYLKQMVEVPHAN
ncbi:MAG TPA: energy-coupling factor transporter ATPase [Anaerolineaceae bacterium]|nr:ATP-binding cassette domain-containing protein [Anaerolineaceae bacterium]HQN04372.1 energy-coupling factor transporter ATPase [Anaerolineaceae bacterium]